MRQTFQKWLFVFIAAAFVFTFALSYFIQTKQARDSALELIRLKILDAKRQLALTAGNVRSVDQITGQAGIAKARALSRMIELQPALLQSAAELNALRVVLDVDEIHVSDASGVLIASQPNNYVGFEMDSTYQSMQFMPAIGNSDFELIQEPIEKGIDGELFQYAGVARRDEPGIVQVGFRPQRREEAMKLADYRRIADNCRIGSNGGIVITRNSRIVSVNAAGMEGRLINALGINSSDIRDGHIFHVKLDSEEYICLAENYNEYSIIGMLPQNEMYISRNSVIFVLIVVNLFLFGIVFVLVSMLVQRVVINGIYRVNASLAKITEGDLEEKVNVEETPEFRLLSSGINSTVDALKKAIAETAARLDAELEFARAIQLSVLPNVFPPYPDHTEFSIQASMAAAKEVGGDFYDFFLIDDDHLAFLVADVSGKGIPAALFMMNAKTLIRSLAETGLAPDQVLCTANNRICANNDAGMFVTALLCVLELSTGKLVCANAGHNPPLLRRRGGAYEYFKLRPGLVLGGMENIRYRAAELTLGAGDSIFLYTDGVTEAQDKQGGLFGEERLALELNSISDSAELLSGVRRAIDRFADGAEQADDITMLLLEYHGSADDDAVLTVPAQRCEWPRVLEWLEVQLQRSNAVPKVQMQLAVAVEELFVNIASYAYDGASGEVELRFRLESSPRAVVMTVTDSGKAYNPLEQDVPDLALSAAERPVGGLGILMVKKIADRVTYDRQGERNVLTVRKEL